MDFKPSKIVTAEILISYLQTTGICTINKQQGPWMKEKSYNKTWNNISYGPFLGQDVVILVFSLFLGCK